MKYNIVTALGGLLCLNVNVILYQECRILVRCKQKHSKISSHNRLRCIVMSVVSHREPPSVPSTSDGLTYWLLTNFQALWGSDYSIKRQKVSTTRIINTDDQTNDLCSSDLLQLQHLLHLLRHVRCQAHGGFSPHCM